VLLLDQIRGAVCVLVVRPTRALRENLLDNAIQHGIGGVSEELTQLMHWQREQQSG